MLPIEPIRLAAINGKSDYPHLLYSAYGLTITRVVDALDLESGEKVSVTFPVGLWDDDGHLKKCF